MQPVVDELLPHMKDIMHLNFGYVGISRYDEGGEGFEREVVRSFAVDGGCAPSLVVRDGSIVLECKRKGGFKKLKDLGFHVEVLYRNMLVCNARMVETGLHKALWDNRNRLWRCIGAGSYYNRPEQIKEQLKNAVIATVFVVYAPVTLQHRFRFASSLPLCT